MRHARTALALPVLALLAAAPAPGQDLYDDTVLRDVRLTFAQPDWETQLRQNWGSEQNIAADLEFEGVTYPDVGVRIKGNSSYFFLPTGSQKFSLNVEVDWTNPDQDVWGWETINLNNGIEDPTFCREVTMYNVLRDFLPVPRANHVNLWINGENWGVYANVQQTNGELLREYFESDEGALWKVPNNPNGPGLQYFGQNPANYFEYELRRSGIANPLPLLIEACRVLEQTPVADLETVGAGTLAVDGMLWHVASENLFMDEDSYISKGADFYCYWDDHHARLELLHHDGNESYGVSLFGWPGGTVTELSPTFNRGNPTKPVLSQFLDDNRLRRRYLAHYRHLVDEVFRWDRLGPRVLGYEALLDAAVAADPKKIYTYQDFLDNFTTDVTIPVGGAGGTVLCPGLQRFVEDRRAYLLTTPIGRERARFSGLAHAPGAPDAGDDVWFSVEVAPPAGGTLDDVRLWWRNVGAYASIPLLDDGANQDGAAGDGVFGGRLPAAAVGEGRPVEYYVEATTSGVPGIAAAFDPPRAELAPASFRFAFGSSGVRVTEVCYGGNDGEFFELTNLGATPADLAGWSYDDQSGDPGTVDLSPLGVLQPGASALVTSADAAAFEAAWGIAGVPLLGGVAAAPLGRNDTIHVWDASGGLVDRLAYGDEEFAGSPRPRESSMSPCEAAVGDSNPWAWSLSILGDAVGSFASASGDVGNPGTFAPAPCAIGVPYCTANANSTGGPAAIGATGSVRLADDELVLSASSVPPQSFGYFLVSLLEDAGTLGGGSQGTLCVGAPIQRLSDHVLGSGPGGTVELDLPPSTLPDPVRPSAGTILHFQYWFRDANPGVTSNSTAGLRIEYR